MSAMAGPHAIKPDIPKDPEFSFDIPDVPQGFRFSFVSFCSEGEPSGGSREASVGNCSHWPILDFPDFPPSPNLRFPFFTGQLQPFQNPLFLMVSLRSNASLMRPWTTPPRSTSQRHPDGPFDLFAIPASVPKLGGSHGLFETFLTTPPMGTFH